jgi:cation diffusion facilitator family transporter
MSVAPAARASAGPDATMRSVLAALAANTAIATAKGIAAAVTGSSALFAETLHTVADAGNEVFLFIAVRRSERPADHSHPLGYAPERYYWALLAAVGMFVIGGAVSIWEGIHALIDPPEIVSFWVGATVLVIALLLDGASRLVASRTLREQARRRETTIRALLRESPDPTVTTVYLEDTIDVIGAALALLALILHQLTGAELPDAIATLIIGALLALTAVRLAGRNRGLLSNQALPDDLVDRLRRQISDQPGVAAVSGVEAVYLGPADVLVAAEVLVEDGMSAAELAEALDRAAGRLHAEVPAITRIYLTPVPPAHRQSQAL